MSKNQNLTHPKAAKLATLEVLDLDSEAGANVNVECDHSLSLALCYFFDSCHGISGFLVDELQI